MLASPLRSWLEEYHRREVDERRDATDAAGRPSATATTLTGVGPIEFLPYGATEERQPICEILATLGPVEAEYASIRRAAGILDSPHRGCIEVTGGDALDFLERMLTAKLTGLAPGESRPSFWLNRKGRIDADVLVVRLDDRLLLELDVAQAEAARRSLESFVFTEDVRLVDRSETQHRLSVHGPAALSVVERAAGADGLAVDEHRARELTIAEASVVVVRRDQVGQCGLELLVPAEHAVAVARALLEADDGRRRLRPVGWLAYNMARIEGGTPLFNVDFGTNSLPHETSLVADRVSFDKGCFLGQEVVARMQHLGKPKQRLVGLRMQAGVMPVAGGQVFEASGERLGNPIGIVTSSTLSPMLGAVPIAFAMLKGDFTDEGTSVLVNAEGEQVPATVGPLRSWDGEVAS